ncbi:MAG TPA: AAA family ATPase [Candidatus Eisenbacteria bacterium]|nr:AAA family ATPase [Candidatus Eisenbacteria bacterium]
MTMTVSRVTIESSGAAKLRLGVLCISMDPGSRATLEVMVAQTPGAHVVDNVDRRIVPREVMRILEPFQYRVCVIDFDDGVEPCCRLAEHLRDNCDNTINLMAASSNSSTDTIIAAMHAGCTGYLVKPFDSERVSSALAHVTAKRHIKEDHSTTARVVTLVGAKGGSGVTSLTLHLGLHLVNRHHQKCLLIDQHPALGDISLYLGLSRRHQYSFYELVNNTDRLDSELLQGYILQHDSGLHVLDSPEVIDNYPHPSPEAIEHTLAFLADSYQFILIDCPPGMTEDTCAAIRQSDQIAIVITPELPPIRNAVRTTQYLVGRHYPEDCIDIVLNRQARNSMLSDEEIEAALQRPIAVKIPNNYSEIARAINAGTPVSLDRNAKLSLAFDQWADRLVGEEPAEAGKTKSASGWLNLFRS